jgi:hypothetical protein
MTIRRLPTKHLTIHESLTTDRIIEAIEADEYIGFCTACGNEQDGCEPDARRYRCEACDERAVYGAQELLLLLGVE